MATNPQLFRSFGVRGVQTAALRLTDDPHTPTTDYAEILVGDGVPSGGYGRAAGTTMLYLRKDASSVNAAYYVTVNGGTNWTALSSAAVGSIADTHTFYTVDTIDGALDALAVLLGATTDATYNFTNGTGSLLTDNDAVYAALNKLDQGFVNLKSTANGKGASLIGVEDAAASLVGANVESALAELSTPVSLSAAAEVADNIVVTVQGCAQVAQYIARLYDSAALLALSSAFTIAETGAGAEVSTTAKSSLIFTTDANGAASLTLHDVAGASSAALFLEVSPFSVQAGAKASPTGVVAITFDGS